MEETVLDKVQELAGELLERSSPPVRGRPGKKSFITEDEEVVGQLVKPPPEDGDLEIGVRTLSGMLLDDAITEMEIAQESVDDKLAMAKKKYAMGVLGYVSKSVMAKEAIKLKRAQEGRENAGFLMELLARAQSGTITERELLLLEQHTKPDSDVQ